MNEMLTIAVLDLAASPRRCSGYASMNLDEMIIFNVSALPVKDLCGAILSLAVAYCYQSGRRLMEIKGKDGIIYQIRALS
ncbi:MAG: hypothetical protein QXR06_00760 [Candidatus Bathyarchaeia archaeon]